MNRIEVLPTGPLYVNSMIVQLAGNDVFIVDPAACKETHDENAIVDLLIEHKKNPVGIFLTHAHFDHVTGINAIKNAFPNCIVALHEGDKFFFQNDNENSSVQMVKHFGLGAIASLLENTNEPEVIFSNTENRTLNDFFYNENCSDETKKLLSSWKIIFTPGHSPGSCCLYSETENALISGDTLFYKSWGRSDFVGGSEEKLQRSLKYLRENLPQETLVFPGHETYGFSLANAFV